jgi:chromosome condensin MukBEF MukE localization factor
MRDGYIYKLRKAGRKESVLRGRGKAPVKYSWTDRVFSFTLTVRPGGNTVEARRGLIGAVGTRRRRAL